MFLEESRGAMSFSKFQFKIKLNLEFVDIAMTINNRQRCYRYKLDLFNYIFRGDTETFSNTALLSLRQHTIEKFKDK